MLEKNNFLQTVLFFILISKSAEDRTMQNYVKKNKNMSVFQFAFIQRQYLFSRTAVVNHHKLHDLKTAEHVFLIALGYRSLKSRYL